MGKRKNGMGAQRRGNSVVDVREQGVAPELVEQGQDDGPEQDEFEPTEKAVVRSERLPDGSIAYFNSEFASAETVRERGA